MKTKQTRTSKFGSKGRVNHDSSRFYSSRLYAETPKETDVEYLETAIPDKNLDQIYSHSSESMSELPDNSIHLMVTSPPYNVGKDFDEDLSLREYRELLSRVWEEVYRVLVPGGRACINLANLGRKPYLPLHTFITADMLEIGFLMRGEIIWDKAASASSSTAWGSWLSASNPTLRDVHEYILIFSKDAYKRVPPEDRTNTINKDQFLAYTKSVWTFPAVSAKKIGHPAPFPEELPMRLIQLYTYAEEIILDPFMGSGQTALAAKNNNRKYIGYETNPDYVNLAQQRLTE